MRGFSPLILVEISLQTSPQLQEMNGMLFGNSAAGNPNGMVNRVGYPSSDHIIQHSQWAQKVDELLQSDAQIYIEIETGFDSSSNSLTIETTTEILESISAPLSLNVIVTESNIIAYQTDYEADPQEIADYEHNQ